MSLMTALNSGATGLNNASNDLSVVGDNIANSATVGYKASRAAFAEAVAQSLNGDASQGQIGLGSQTSSIQRLMTQGALSSTGVATDLAIDGDGFFVIRKLADTQAAYYTRDGQFSLDKDGYLSTLQGGRVQGYIADSSGVLNTASVNDMQIGSASTRALPTQTMTIRANLQADATVIAAFDPADAAGTSNFSTATTLYDSLGAAHQATIYFTKNSTGPNVWSYNVLTDPNKVTTPINDPPPVGVPAVIAQGTLEFDTEGRLAVLGAQTVSFNPIGASAQPIAFNFGTAYDPTISGSGLNGVTQFATASSVSFLTQDGSTAGSLSRVTIDGQGRVVGAFTNGSTRVLAQVVLASFEAPDKLSRTSGNLFQSMPESGLATVGAPSTGGHGSIVANTLEMSNVDMAGEFIRMIQAQRVFQANSKTLTTADQLLQELMTLKR